MSQAKKLKPWQHLVGGVILVAILFSVVDSEDSSSNESSDSPAEATPAAVAADHPEVDWGREQREIERLTALAYAERPKPEGEIRRVKAIDLQASFLKNWQGATDLYADSYWIVEGTVMDVNPSPDGETFVHLAGRDPLFPAVTCILLKSQRTKGDQLYEKQKVAIQGYVRGYPKVSQPTASISVDLEWCEVIEAQ